MIEHSQPSEASRAARMPLTVMPRSAMGLPCDKQLACVDLPSSDIAPAARPPKRRRSAKRLYTAESMLSPWEAAEAAEKLRAEQELLEDEELLKDLSGI